MLSNFLPILLSIPRINIPIKSINRNNFSEALLSKRLCKMQSRKTNKTTDFGIEAADMIRKGQLSEENMPAYKQFIALAG
jgi:hypothetical protein